FWRGLRPYPCRRRRRSASIASFSRRSPAGSPTTIAASAGPWDSPAVTPSSAMPTSRAPRSRRQATGGRRNEAPRLAALGHGPRRWRARDRERGNERDTPGGLSPNVVGDEAVREARGLGPTAPCPSEARGGHHPHA